MVDTSEERLGISPFEPLEESPLRRKRSLMRNSEECKSWTVYQMTIHGKPTGRNAVCEQREWDAMELAKPGLHTLVQAGITNEGEAERLARRSSVDGNTSSSAETKSTKR
jgi:hypothetical protein